MRCEDIYDRHDISATPCTCSEAKTNLRSHDLRNMGTKETSKYKSECNFSHIRKVLMTCVILA